MAGTAGCAGALDVLEGPLVRVPFESLKRAAKERKALVDKADAATKALAAAVAGGPAGNEADQFTQLLLTLQDLRDRMAEVSQQEAAEAERCRARLQHLEDLTLQQQNMVAWNAPRLDRLLVDYLHRAGCFATAERLAQASGIQPLVDSHIFAEAKQVADALRAKDCGPCLAWCAANRTRLSKAKSRFELQLRIQEFMEHVKRGDRLGAIAHARLYLAPWADTCLPEVQRALGVLVFAHRPSIPPRYAELLHESRWDALVQLFLQELYKLHGLPSAPPLMAHLQAGLSALKTPASYLPGASREDPLSNPSFRELAQDLPFAKHVRSQLLCSVTHRLMDEDNPPVVLPNGYVYSQQAVDAIRAANGGRMVCPCTGSSYTADELRRAYIV